MKIQRTPAQIVDPMTLGALQAIVYFYINRRYYFVKMEELNQINLFSFFISVSFL